MAAIAEAAGEAGTASSGSVMLDRLVLDAIAASGVQAPGTASILVGIRKAMSKIMAVGYNPDTLILTPANAEAIYTMVSGITGGTADFIFGAGSFAPGTVFGLQKRISKTIPAAAVVDSQALGKLYASRVSLARSEEDAGKTNTAWCASRSTRCSASSARPPPSGSPRRSDVVVGAASTRRTPVRATSSSA